MKRYPARTFIYGAKQHACLPVDLTCTGFLYLKMRSQSESHTVKISTEYGSGGVTLHGITSKIWGKGLFKKTQKPFHENTATSIRLKLPTGKACNLMGIVKRTRRRILFRHLNGMEVELHFTHRNYIEFLDLLRKKEGAS
jgi:hypothetical protein